MTATKIKTYEQLKDKIGEKKFNSILELFVDLNREVILNELLNTTKVNSEIIHYDLINREVIYIHTPGGNKLTIPL